MITKTDLKSYLVMSVFLLGMAGLVQARTITVGHGANYDFNTIQAAINAATHGDTVVVADGTYKGLGNRDIDFNGKAITVRSENGPELTIIDCNGSSGNEHRGFYFHSGEYSNSVLQGFTITNGYVINTHGGGIWCEYSSPVVTKCILSNNTARSVTTGVSAFGGGIFNRYNSSPTVTNCTFSGNSAGWGGGIWNGIGSGLSRQNKLSANTITKVLSDVHKGRHWRVYKASLAVGGVDGTIARYFKEQQYRGKIFGKTGYMLGVRAFSGVCTTEDGDYIFSILANNTNSKTRNAIHDIAKAIIDTE